VGFAGAGGGDVGEWEEWAGIVVVLGLRKGVRGGFGAGFDLGGGDGGFAFFALIKGGY
jgi:hypothetical protein